MRVFAAVIFLAMLVVSPAHAQTPSLNSFVLRAVDLLAAERSAGGYDINAAFTRDLQYGEDCCIRAIRAPQTQCVAAVTEVIVTALELYARETGDQTVYVRVPIELWTTHTVGSLRANIFMYAGTGSAGTADTLQRFGLGRELPFGELEPGDFINFNRPATAHARASGHAVVFLGYIHRAGNVDAVFADDVVGFRYFSAQSTGDAGLGFRRAYFGEFCPPRGEGERRDCGVIRSSNRVLLNAGRLHHPSEWTIEAARAELEASVRAAVSADLAEPMRTTRNIEDRTRRELARELLPLDAGRFTGATTD